ncbi:hypothetical protein AcW1_002332 [Taiwanofungus camphoratus]|nr:hypothetical protein AcV5_010336 [Antrodia cinnamomea]KAI0938008.1 hypothetical protein AcV7_003321 [Antrodia cinnamomea]KAI0944677.1 hypothetical protein AcW1_002332 [Antrodia cinnamomea]
MDATHLPYGCSVWPSFWTKGENWPEGGEIDIVEAVNQMANNQMALHTNNGCSASGSNQTGSLSNANCSVSAGCTYEETQSNSYGTGFNSAGGGVWATLFDTTGIYIWFWSRANVPSSISSANSSVDPSSFGTPSAAFPSSSCNISEFFTPQQLVLDITLCGDWAGLPQIYTETCPVQGTANASSCYLQNVINNGTSQYAEAYFEIAYIKAFNAHSTVVTPSGASSSVAPSSTGSGSGSGSGSSGGSGKSSGALGSVRLAWGAQGRAAALAAGVLGLAAWTLL